MKDIVKEDFNDIDDLQLGNVGAELDKDDTGGKGFEKDAMFDQLGKILDSQSNPNPITTVKTDDDGWTIRTLDGTFSAHFEHTIAVTADGPLVLSKAKA